MTLIKKKKGIELYKGKIVINTYFIKKCKNFILMKSIIPSKIVIL